MPTQRNKTFQDLLDWLNGLTTEQLQNNISIWDAAEDEYYPVPNDNGFLLAGEENGVLDEGHPVIRF